LPEAPYDSFALRALYAQAPGRKITGAGYAEPDEAG